MYFICSSWKYSSVNNTAAISVHLPGKDLQVSQWAEQLYRGGKLKERLTNPAPVEIMIEPVTKSLKLTRHHYTTQPSTIWFFVKSMMRGPKNY